MSLAVPSALILSLIALPILVLYVLKVRLRRIPVSTNMFWKQMFDEKPPRALWRKLRHLVSLLAQLLILALLVLAIADPFFKWQSASARRIVLVMDTSASMQAADVSPTRFDAARQAAIRVLDGVRETDSVAIVSASNRPEVVLGMGGHVPTLKAALTSMKPSDGTASIEQAVTLAKQLIGDHPNGQVIVLTDGCARSAEKDTKVEQLDTTTESAAQPVAPASDEKPAESTTVTDAAKATPTDSEIKSDAKLDPKPDQQPDKASDTAINKDSNAKSDSKTESDSKMAAKNAIDVQYVYFATESASNVGITQLQARRSLIDALGYQVLVSVQNSSKKPIKCRLEIELDSVPVDVLPLELQPGQKWSRTLEKTSLEGGVLKASLSRIQAVQGDGKPSGSDSTATDSPDSPKASTANASDLNHMLVDDQAWAVVPPRVIQKVLVVSPGNLFLQKVFQANQLVKLAVTKELPSQWPEDTIVVCHKLVPEKLPEGKLLIIDPESNCDLLQVGQPIENPIVTKQDDKSPLMTHVRLDNVLIPDAKQLTFTNETGLVKLAQTVGGEVVFAAQNSAKSKRLILSVNLEKSDLAFRTAFPILVSNSLSWFSGGNGQLEPSIEAGSNVKLAINSDDVGNSTIRDDAKSTSTTVTPQDAKSGKQDTANSKNAESKVANSKPGKQRWLISPDMKPQQLASTITGPLTQVGVWKVVDGTLPEKSTDKKSPVEVLLEDGNVLQHIAVNLASENESDLTPNKDTSSTSASLQANWFTRPLWFYLAALVCLLSVIEWCLYQRRIIT